MGEQGVRTGVMTEHPADAVPGAGTEAWTPPDEPRSWQRWAVVAVLLIASVAAPVLTYGVIGSPDLLLALGTVTASGVCAVKGLELAGRLRFGPRFDIGFWLSVGWLVLLSTAAALAGVLPLAEHVDASKTLHDPGYATPDLFSKHPLGTNSFSLDLLSRSLYGARVSLLTALVAMSISLLVGGLIGMAAGFYRGKLDTTVSMLTDAALSFPALVLLIAFAAVLGVPGSVPEAVLKNGLVLGVVATPIMIRLARANTLVFAQREFVLASRSLGARGRHILWRSLMPNVASPMLSYVFVNLAVLIVAEGSLAFLGLGLQQPQPTWGNMIAEADLTVLREHPHIALVPGAFMFLTVLAFNRIGERIRHRTHPVEAKV